MSLTTNIHILYCVQNHRKLDNIWFWDKPSVEGDLSDFDFYMPDNPNDRDLLAIR